jgi:hypothetical protein
MAECAFNAATCSAVLPLPSCAGDSFFISKGFDHFLL